MKPVKLNILTDKGTLQIILSKTIDYKVLIIVIDDRTGESVRLIIPVSGAVELSRALVAFAIELKQEIRNIKLPDTVDEIVKMIDRRPVALKSKGDPIVLSDPDVEIYKN